MKAPQYRELIIGCGKRLTKDLRLPTAVEIAAAVVGTGKATGPMLGTRQGRSGLEFQDRYTLDINPDHEPDMLCNLAYLPEGLFEIFKVNRQCWDVLERSEDLDNVVAHFLPHSFDEIHAYEVLEHIGMQGDAHTFFAQFTEFHRMLRPGGLFFATVPSWSSQWAWGDPDHKRVITAGTLAFLSQEQYRQQVGITPMSDYRYIYKADFRCLYVQETADALCFVLQAA